LIIGIDVAKEKLDLARSDAEAVVSFPNDAAGIVRIVRLLTEAGPACVVVEATGGLERALSDALLEADLPAALSVVKSNISGGLIVATAC
jgi:transposase